MKRKKLLSSLSLADEKYLAEADPGAKKGKRIRYLPILVAACLCLVTVLNLYLFIPFSTKGPDLSRYADSEYYGVIERISAYNQSLKRSRYKNNFEKLVAKAEDLFGVMDKDASGGDFAGGATGAPMEEGRYEETTDNQTAGVIEGDRIKRSDSHIYYLSGSVLSVYSIRGEDSECVASFDLKRLPFLMSADAYHDTWEIFLSKDCKTVTVVAPYYSYEQKEACVSLISLDVSDPTSPTHKNTFTVTGSYLSSRSVDGALLLFTRFRADYNPDFDDESTFLPQINTGEGFTSVPADGIVFPETLSSTTYTVALMIGEDGLALRGAAAFLSYSTEVYVSAENIYAMRTYRETKSEENRSIYSSFTEISVLSYKDGFRHLGSTAVRGTVKDRYSLDEYEGVLRVVTTTSETVQLYEGAGYNDADVSASARQKTNASIYCIRLSDLSVLAKLESFAPEGESVQSVRFDGDAAYVCTSIVLSDPVFYFDLSDLPNITYKDTGTIEGFSSSLVSLGDGLLLGIGVGSFDSVKLEIYKETANGVLPLSKYEFKNAYYSLNYKAYYINREDRFFGLGISDYYTGTSRYAVLFFDGYDLRLLFEAPVDGSDDCKRAVLVDGYFYIFGENGSYIHSITH